MHGFVHPRHIQSQAFGKPSAIRIKGRFSALSQRNQLVKLERLAETHFWVHCYRKPNFYDVLGGMVVAEREDKRGKGIILAEIAYGWASVASLATAAP